MTLQRIETGNTSPSVAVLAQIAHHLLRPIHFFITDEHPRIQVLKKEDHQVVAAPNMTLTIIAPVGLIDENVFVNVGEAKGGRFIDSHTEDGHSFVYMLKGRALFEYEGVNYELKPGDALYYNASYPHSVTAVGKHKFISVFFKGKR